MKLSPEELLAMVREGRIAEFLGHAEELDPADLADVLTEADEQERIEIVKLLPPLLSGQALSEMPLEEHAEDTLAALEPEQAAEILEEMPDDDAADLLGEMEPREQQLILSKVEDAEQREEVRDLLQYEPESAGGLPAGGGRDRPPLGGLVELVEDRADDRLEQVFQGDDA